MASYWGQFSKDPPLDSSKKEVTVKTPSKRKKKQQVVLSTPEIFKESQVDELLKIKKLRAEKPKKSKKPHAANPINTPDTPQQIMTKNEREMLNFSQLFGTEGTDLTGNFFFRGTPTNYMNESDNKKVEEIANDFTQKIQLKTKRGNEVLNDVQNSENTKKILKNTTLERFKNIKFKDSEDNWTISSEVLENNLDERERLLSEALIRGETWIQKKLKKDPKNLRTPPEVPILPPSYFVDFQRPARGVPLFNERPCVKGEKCYAFLRTIKATDINPLKTKNAWIAREFLLPHEVEAIRKDPSFLKTLPNKRCIFCNRLRTEAQYLEYKNSPRSMSFNVDKLEPIFYYKEKDPEEGVFIIQDHIVKIQDLTSNNNNSVIWKEEDVYPRDNNIIMPDPVNGIIGPFKRLTNEELQLVHVPLQIDSNGTIGDVPSLRECNFF